MPADRLKVDRNRVAAEQIFQLDIAELANVRCSANDVSQRRHCFERKSRFLALVDNALHLLARSRRNRDQDLVDGINLSLRFEFVNSAENRDSVNLDPIL